MNQPNILIVISDQLCRQVLSCYGDTNWKSKHIDHLAETGVRFEQACSTTPVCVPFRFSLMTGQYAHSRMVPTINWRMSPAERTLADEYNEAGYETVYVGKWHLWGGLGPWAMKRPIPREHRGRWQKWLGYEFRNDVYDNVYFEDDDPTPHKLEGYGTDAVFSTAIDYLTRRRDTSKPFCACISVEPPHPPMKAPEALETKWLNTTSFNLPENFMVPAEESVPGKVVDNADEAEHRRRIYYAMVENLDQNVGRLMSELAAHELDHNTIVVFMSDHGELAGCHMRNEKQHPYEESIGIPLIVWGPGCGIDGGGVTKAPVCSEDLMPTLCGLGNVTPRDTLPGMNLAPYLFGEVPEPNRPGVMLELVDELRPHMPYYKEPWRGFRSRQYKYTVKQDGDRGMQPWQLFDLVQDPCEMTNRITDVSYRTIATAHHGWLRQRMAETNDHAWLADAFGWPALNRWPLGAES